MPICYMLIGCPGSGKTTFLNKNFYDFPRDAEGSLPFITGTDLYIERIAEALEATYSEVFKDAYKLAEKCFWNDIQSAASGQESIIIDRTNMTRKGRKKFFDALNGYRFEAIIFNEPDNLGERLASRRGKEISRDIVQSMLNSYDAPSFAEGFCAVWDASLFVESLQK
jgi:predicted kinase